MRIVRQRRFVTTLELPQLLIEEAARLGVDVQESCERGLRAAVEEAWLNQNREVLNACNTYVAANGLPLARERDALWNEASKS